MVLSPLSGGVFCCNKKAAGLYAAAFCNWLCHNKWLIFDEK